MSTVSEGCGEGLAVATPRTIAERPGLARLEGRLGDQASLLATLTARLSLSKQPALARLTSRDPADFTLGLLDAWACVGDVLSFYQQRIANESYLGTASERLSVLHLTRLVGYEMRPGVAASAFLAFTIEDPPGASRRVAPSSDQPAGFNSAQLGVPGEVRLTAGLKVQSLPGPGQSAQIFETVEAITARASWNAIAPRRTRRQSVGASTLRLAGLATALRRGDGLLIPSEASGEMKFGRIAALELDPPNLGTLVTLDALIAAGSPPGPEELARQALGPGAQSFAGQIVACADFEARARSLGRSPQDLLDNVLACRAGAPRVIALRGRAAIFGHNAPRYAALPAAQRFAEYAPVKATQSPLRELAPAKSAAPTSVAGLDYAWVEAGYAGRLNSWAESTLARYPGEASDSRRIYLDSVHTGITAGSWVVLVDGSEALAFRVEQVAEVSHTDFTISARVSCLTLSSREGLERFRIRTTAVHCESELLPLARQILDEAVSGDTIALEGLVDGLRAGQRIAISGELDDERGVTASEVATLARAEHDLSATDGEAWTRITLRSALARPYVRATVSLNANVALATHGETVANFGAAGETLGSGDARLAFQSFTLAQQPLCWTSAANERGAQASLELRVNGLLWQEVPRLYGCSPRDRVYLVRTEDDGSSRVIFGDGLTGARLPSGQANVSANYRKGSGSAGRVAANQLSQLLSRPLGLKSVTNPLAAEGGAERESLAAARGRAPLAILTLGRIVSRQDFEDFAAAFPGIGKAWALPDPRRGRRAIHLSVAGEDGADLAAGGPVLGKLVEAIAAVGDPLIALSISPSVRRSFRVALRIASDPAWRRADVLAAVELALREAFSFAARRFGQRVEACEVLAAIHRVPGVRAGVLDLFHLVPLGATAAIAEEDPSLVHDSLPAASPTLLADGRLAPADLLLLDASPLNPGAL